MTISKLEEREEKRIELFQPERLIFRATFIADGAADVILRLQSGLLLAGYSRGRLLLIDLERGQVVCDLRI